MAERPSWRDYAGLRRRVARLERELPLGDTSWHGAVAVAAAVDAGEDARAPGAGGTPAVRSRLVLPPTVTVPSAALEALLDLVDRARLGVQNAAGGSLLDRLRRLTEAEARLDQATDQLITWLDGAMVAVEVGVDWGREEFAAPVWNQRDAEAAAGALTRSRSPHTAPAAAPGFPPGPGAPSGPHDYSPDRSHPAPVTAPDPHLGRAPEPGFVLTRRGRAAAGSGAARPWRAQPALLAALCLACGVVAIALAWLEVVG